MRPNFSAYGQTAATGRWPWHDEEAPRQLGARPYGGAARGLWWAASSVVKSSSLKTSVGGQKEARRGCFNVMLQHYGASKRFEGYDSAGLRPHSSVVRGVRGASLSRLLSVWLTAAHVSTVRVVGSRKPSSIRRARSGQERLGGKAHGQPDPVYYVHQQQKTTMRLASGP